MRTKKEVVQGIKYLIERYVSDQDKKLKYLTEINDIYPPPIRGIFSEMERDGIEIREDDSDLVHDAFFYFG